MRIGQLEIDSVSFEEALARIEELVSRREGGAVFTPNVDHVVKAERDVAFREAYARASLSLADGMPLLWASRLLGAPLPEKISGSDLVIPLARLAARKGWRVYLLGGEPGVAQEAGDRLARELGLNVVGTDSPVIRPDGGADDAEQLLERLRAAKPDLLLVALGAPKQELFIDRFAKQIGPVVALGCRREPRLRRRTSQARTEVDVPGRSGVGVSARAGAATHVEALSDRGSGVRRDRRS